MWHPIETSVRSPLAPSLPLSLLSALSPPLLLLSPLSLHSPQPPLSLTLTLSPFLRPLTLAVLLPLQAWLPVPSLSADRRREPDTNLLLRNVQMQPVTGN